MQYNLSVVHYIIAKVYSNLAASLCKLGKYDDAYDAAQLGTKVDDTWAKGHWRLGSVSELSKSKHNTDRY